MHFQYWLAFLLLMFPFALAQVSKLHVFVAFRETVEGSPQEGTKDDPFSGLDTALNKISSLVSDETQVTVYIAPANQPYSLQNLDSDWLLGDVTGLTLKTWRNSPFCENSENLATLNITGPHLLVDGINFFNFENVNLIAESGSINSKCQNMMLRSVNVIASSFLNVSVFKLFGTENITLTNVNITMTKWGPFLDSANDFIEQYANITFENVVIKLNDGNILSLNQPSSPLFSIDGLSRQIHRGKVSVNNLKFELDTSDETLILPMRPLLRIKNFESAEIHDFSLDNRKLSLIPLQSFLEFENLKSLQLASINLYQNHITVPSNSNFISIKEVQTIVINSLKLNSNHLQTLKSDPLHFHLSLFDIVDARKIKIFDNSLSSNTFDGFIRIFKLRGSESSPDVDLEINKLLMHENNNNQLSSNLFTYLSLQGITLSALNINDITYQANQLSGRIFSFQTSLNSENHLLDSILPPTKLSLSQISILDNRYSKDFGFLYFTSNGDVLSSEECLQILEPYTLQIDNLSLLNNSFAKNSNNLWFYEVSLFDIRQTQVSFDNLNLTDAIFEYYNFINLDQKPSTIVIKTSTFKDITLSSSQLIATNYLNKFCFNPLPGHSLDSSTPLYRYSFIYGSNFSGIILDNSGLLELDNGFLLLHKNTFYNVSLLESSLVKTEFSPLRVLGGRGTSKSISNIEKSAFSNLPEAWDLYNQTFSLAKAASPRLKYFYWVSNNTFNKIGMGNDLLNFIVIRGLGSHESLIKFIYNSFQSVSFDLDDTLNAIVDIDEIDTLEILGNEFNNLDEKLKIFLLSMSSIDSSLLISSNNLKSVNAHSFVSLKGKLISGVKINRNYVTKSQFSHTLISINVEKSYDDWIFENNRLILVDFLFDIQRVEGERFGLLQFLNGRSIDSSQIRLTNNIFKDLNFSKKEAHESPIQLCLLLLQTKQTINLTNNILRGVKNYNPGNLIYMLNLPAFIIKNCSFVLIEYKSFTGMISLSSAGVYVSNSTFDRISNDESFGIFHLRTVLDAYTVEIKNSTFIDLNIQNQAGVLAVRSSDYSSEAQPDFFKLSLPQLNLEISDCNIVNLFGAHSIHLAEVACNCTISQTFFNISNQLRQSPLEVVEGVTGTLQILSPKLELKTAGNHPFLRLSNFRGQTSINDFHFNAGDLTFYLIDMDTGSLRLANSSFNKIGYAIVKTPFIGIRPTSQTLISLIEKYYPKVLVENVTFAGFTFWSMTRQKLMEMGLFFFNFDSVLSHGPQTLSLLGYQYNSTSRYQTLNIIFSALPIQLTVQNCSFTDFNHVNAIMIASSSDPLLSDQLKIPSSKILVNNSKFSKIVYTFGSGLAVLPSSYYPLVEVLNSTFEGNTAYTGGAIAVCNTSLAISNSTFQRNRAALVGPAVFLGGSTISKMNSKDNFFNSSFMKFQGDVGTEAVDFKLSLIYHGSVSQKIEPDHLLQISNVELQNATLKLEYIDANGQLAPVFTDSATPISLTFSIPQNAPKNLQDRFTSSFQSFNTTWGMISLSNIILGGFAQENVSLIFRHVSERINKEIMINITFRSCQPGEYNNTKTHQCQSCVYPTFTVNSSQPCTNCPDNADCPGQSQIVPKPNYWSTGPQSSAIIKCRDGGFNRCENKNNQQSCLEGYAGPLCEACDFKNSFVETGYLKCGQCKDPQQSLKYSVIFGVCYFFYQIFSVNAVYAANKFTSTNQNNYLVKRRVERSFYIKSLLTYTQIMSVLYIGNSHITKSLGLSAQFGNPSSLILYGTQCSLKAINVHYEDFLYVQTYSVILSPIIQLVGITLFMLIIRWIFNFASASKVIATAAVYFLISYQPGIATSLTQFLSCTGSHIVGYDYVESHPAWTCTSEKYLFAANYIAKPALALICFILPMVILSTLISKRKKIHSEELSASLGMLFFDLNPSHYYWGVILMVLKLALSFLVYGMNQDSKMQIYVSLVLLWGYQSMVRIIEPYKTKAYNKFELIVINLLMFNIVVSTYMLGDDNSSWVTKASIGLSLILNGGFLILTAWKIISLTILDIISTVETKIMNRRITRSPQLLDESTMVL